MPIDDQLISDLTNSHKSYINQISIGYQSDIYPIDDLLIEIWLVYSNNLWCNMNNNNIYVFLITNIIKDFIL